MAKWFLETKDDSKAFAIKKLKNLIHEYFSAARKEIVMQLKELASHANLLAIEKEIYQTSDD